jgi:actin-like ATPase involved in cell morphogenesis
MALSGSDIKQMIYGSNNIDDYCNKLARAINRNLEAEIPAGSVIVQVTGGSGAPAVGVSNSSPITCNIVEG